MRRKVSPFLLLCLMGGLAILSSTMAKNPALPLFICSLGMSKIPRPAPVPAQE